MAIREDKLLSHYPDWMFRNRRHHIRTPGEAGIYFRQTLMGCLLGEERHRRLVDQVFDQSAFWLWPASTKHHHAFGGGLAVHTAQVCQGLHDLLSSLVNSRWELALIAGVWHDYAKIFDYEQAPDGTWRDAAYRHSIRHVPGSYAEFVTVNRKLELLSRDEEDFVGHLILAHHGRLEWQSPVEPACAEAWALHAADMLSAHFIDANDPYPGNVPEKAASNASCS